MLISPAQGGGLNALGKIYNLDKKPVSREDMEDMELYRERELDRFYEYGIQDAIIPLVHSCKMEEFYRGLGGTGFPITLSSIGTKFVVKT